MFQSSILPQYKAVYYANNPQTGYYLKTDIQPDKTAVMRLPYELKVEPSQVHKIKCNASEIIRGKEKRKNGSFKFFTGLQTTNFNQWYCGNDYEFSKGEKILSLCLFHFSTDGRLTVFYFSRYYKEGREQREKLVNGIIPQLIKKHFLTPSFYEEMG